MFEVEWMPEASEQYRQLRAKAKAAYEKRQAGKRKKQSKDEGLFKQVQKTVNNLRTNPRHPGLQTHEYHSLDHPWQKGEKVFEAYAQNKTPAAYRVFWCYGPDRRQITIISITQHP